MTEPMELTDVERKACLKGLQDGLATYINKPGCKVTFSWSRPVVEDVEKTHDKADGSIWKKHGPDVYLSVHIKLKGSH